MKNRPKAKATKWPFSFNEQWNGWGWSVFFGQLIIAFGFLVFGLAHFAFASRQPGSYDFSYVQQRVVPPAQANAMNIRGKIHWKDGVAQLEDESTGAVYRLSNPDTVRVLYNQGVRSVAVSGILTGADTLNATIDVQTMSAVH